MTSSTHTHTHTHMQLDLRCRMIVSTGQLVGNEVSQLFAHLPATHHLLLSIQHTMQTGNSVYSKRERERVNNNSGEAPDIFRAPVKMDGGRRLEM